MVQERNFPSLNSHSSGLLCSWKKKSLTGNFHLFFCSGCSYIIYKSYHPTAPFTLEMPTLLMKVFHFLICSGYSNLINEIYFIFLAVTAMTILFLREVFHFSSLFASSVVTLLMKILYCYVCTGIDFFFFFKKIMKQVFLFFEYLSSSCFVL